MDVSDAKRLKALEAENSGLKKLAADAMLEKEVTKEALRKNGDRTASSGARAVDAAKGLSQHRCLGVAAISASSFTSHERIATPSCERR